MAKNQRGLGRGLDALLPSISDIDEGVMDVPIEKVSARKGQPRHSFGEESLAELSDSIKEHGILQPLLLRPKGDKYEIVAGERRWRAANMAGLTKVPAIVKEMDDLQATEVALIENIQRDDLTIIEEAAAYRNLIDQFGYTQESLANRVGKSRSHITNCLRILTLPQQVVEMVEKGVITGGHARALLSLGEEKDIIKAAQEVAAGKLSVRQTEAKVKNKPHKPGKNNNNEIRETERQLEEKYGTRVRIMERGGRGKIEITYFSREELERILELMDLKEGI
ncbi:MAG TPA: ParB/RepB/Spo0J family partition protein [Syntrophomonadaceae bacterium]|nr:ParB/RepB/Spo0J family partition protein [Syntrophomonadaceae bacterium]